MPKAKTTTGKMPANQQKGSKVCSCCGENKKLTEYYLSYNPMYSVDQRVPICKACCKERSLNSDGTINYPKFKEILKNIGKPLFYDSLWSSFETVKRENSYLSEEEVELHGEDIIARYFRNIAMRQDRALSFSESESMNFMHQNNNRSNEEKEKILNKYLPLFEVETSNNIDIITNTSQKSSEVEWSQQDIQNMDYAIDIIGYDPFVGYPENDRRFLFNQLAPYLEDDDIADDAYKLSQILQIVDNNKQIRQCDVRIANLDPIKDAESIKTLNSIKKDLVQSNDKIAKENEISVKNRSNKDVGRSTLTYLMRDLRNKNFDKAEADYYDQLRSAGTRWAVDMSMTSIVQNGMFDENDKKEIYETQLHLIDKLNQELDECKEKIRLLLLEIDRLKAGVGDE